VSARYRPEGKRVSVHEEPAAEPPRTLAPVVQSIMSIVIRHQPDGRMGGVELRTAGPLEGMPAVAAQVLREIADQLQPQIQTATTLPNGSPH
jgi:hypothetical protein